MTGGGRHEGSIARHEGGGSVFSCVVTDRFRDLAEAGDRARRAKVVLSAPAPRTP